MAATPEDPTGWIVDNPLAELFMLNSRELMHMAFFGYTFFHGIKVFKLVAPEAATSFKFALYVLTCLGGGTLVPIFINAIPVPIANDAYILAIVSSFLIHHFFGVLREVYEISPFVKVLVVTLFELTRAKIVVKFTLMAATKIAPSLFGKAIFGPIVCGAISGCGGAFFPLSKGLDPIKKGLPPIMLSALIGSTFFHLFLATPWSEGCINAEKKAHVHLACFFVAVGLAQAFSLSVKSVVEVPKKIQ